MDFDLKIAGGTIVDGTGAPRYRGDVGVRAGKVVALGKVEGSAARTVEVDGAVVAPGFVDIHTHYDAQIAWDRMLTVSPWHGVTSVVMGNCGFGIAPTRAAHRELIVQSLEKVEGMDPASLRAGLGDPWPFETFPEYLSFIERRGMAINAGVLAGHLPTRFYVMGEAAIERHATPDEVARMRELVRLALASGALGFGTSYGEVHVGYGGRPVASRYASYEETRALAGVLREFPGAVFAPNAGKELHLDRLAEIARDTGANVLWIPLISDLVTHVGDHREELAHNNALAGQGLTIAPQVSPRPVTFEYQFLAPLHFEGLDAFKPVSTLDRDGKREAFRKSGFRAAMRDAIASMPTLFQEAVRLTVVGDGAAPGLEGQRLGDIAAARRTSPIEAALEIAADSNLDARFRMPLGNIRDEETAHLLFDPNTVIGLSDAGAHASQICDACIPTYFLAHWVREKQAIELEQAVRMLTSRPADLYNLPDRGRLGVGLPADIVVFDPDTVADGPLRRVWDLPANGNRLIADAIGIEAVVVNGTLIRQGGKDAVDPAGPLPGAVLRRRR